MSSFVSAKQAEIIRSHQKDDFYTNHVKSALTEITQGWLGPRVWIRWRHELDLLADVGYFILTTVSGYQTLGEEYVNILPVNSTRTALPSGMRRVAMVALQIVTPYLLHRILNWLEKEMRQNMALNISPQGREAAIKVIGSFRSTLTFLHRCHLAVFYLSGAFYHIAKRFTGISYLLVRPNMQNTARPSYKILGWLSLIQLGFVLIQSSMQLIRKRTPLKSSQDYMYNTGAASKVSAPSASDPQRKCPLCLEMRQNATASPCGHIFCWDCIVEWCSFKPQCPLCREPSELNRLIFLRNFDPS